MSALVYTCCFCGFGTTDPVSVEVWFDWADKSEENAARQTWFAHSACLVDRLHPTVREFSPAVSRRLRLDDSYRSGAYE